MCHEEGASVYAWHRHPLGTFGDDSPFLRVEDGSTLGGGGCKSLALICLLLTNEMVSWSNLLFRFPVCWALVLRLAGMACEEVFYIGLGIMGFILYFASCLVCDLVSLGRHLKLVD